MKNETIYCGSGRIYKGNFGDVPKISMSKKDINTIVDYMKQNKLEWVNLELLEKRNKEEKKPTHYLKIDTWKKEQSTVSNKPIDKQDDYSSSNETEDLPF